MSLRAERGEARQTSSDPKAREDRRCPECNGNCARIDFSIRGRERFVPCARCDGKGRVKARATP